MNLKLIDQYFQRTRDLPLAMSLEEVQALVRIKGAAVAAQSQSWWNLKKIIFMTTTAIIITTSILLLSPDKITIEKPIPEENINIEHVFNPENLEVNELELPYPDKSLNNTKITPVDSVLKKVLTIPSRKPELITEQQQLSPLPSMVTIPSLPHEIEEVNLPIIEQNKDPKSKNELPSKTVVKEKIADDIDWVVVSNFKGEITVDTWDKNTVQLKATLSIDGKDEDNIKKVLEDFDFDLVKSGHKLEIKNEWLKGDGCKCPSNNVKGKITTKNGDKVKIKEYTIDYVLTTPKKMSLELENSYGNIEVQDVDGNLDVSSFQGDLNVDNVSGELNLTSKYGKVSIQRFSGGKVTLFQSKAKLGKSNDMDLNAKYSQVEIDGTNEIELKAFQSNIIAVRDIDKVTGSIKYGDLIVGENARSVDLIMFQAKVDVKEVNDFIMEGSYSKIKVESIKNLDIKSSFQNDYKIGEVTTIKGDVKYTSFDIGVLKYSLELGTFQGNIIVDKVLANFNTLDIESKYTPITIKFSPDSKFNIDVESKYTDIDYSKENFVMSAMGNENQRKDFKGVFNTSNNKEPSSVNVVAFQGKLTLK